MSSVSSDDVKKLARLSALTLTDAEVEKMQTELSSVLDYVEQLQEVNTEGVEPTYQVNGLESVMRDDVVIDYQVSQEALLQNTPGTRDGAIVVPRVLE